MEGWFGRNLACPVLPQLLFIIIFVLLSVPVHSRDEEDDLLQGINSFRQASKLPALAKHDKANCVADEIADQLENKACSSVATQSQITSDYPNVLQKCKVDINATRDGVVLPVCVPHRVSTLVLTNYTHSPNAKHLNDSKFTGAGIGKEDDWTVLVLATDTPGGSFASQGCRAGVPVFNPSQYLVALLLVLIVEFVC